MLRDVVGKREQTEHHDRAAGEIEEAQDIPDGSPLSNILKKLGDGGSMKLDSLKRIVRKEDKLRAAVHDRVEIVKQLRSL